MVPTDPYSDDFGTDDSGQRPAEGFSGQAGEGARFGASDPDQGGNSYDPGSPLPSSPDLTGQPAPLQMPPDPFAQAAAAEQDDAAGQMVDSEPLVARGEAVEILDDEPLEGDPGFEDAYGYDDEDPYVDDEGQQGQSLAELERDIGRRKALRATAIGAALLGMLGGGGYYAWNAGLLPLDALRGLGEPDEMASSVEAPAAPRLGRDETPELQLEPAPETPELALEAPGVQQPADAPERARSDEAAAVELPEPSALIGGLFRSPEPQGPPVADPQPVALGDEPAFDPFGELDGVAVREERELPADPDAGASPELRPPSAYGALAQAQPLEPYENFTGFDEPQGAAPTFEESLEESFERSARIEDPELLALMTFDFGMHEGYGSLDTSGGELDDPAAELELDEPSEFAFGAPEQLAAADETPTSAPSEFLDAPTTEPFGEALAEGGTGERFGAGEQRAADAPELDPELPVDSDGAALALAEALGGSDGADGAAALEPEALADSAPGANDLLLDPTEGLQPEADDEPQDWVTLPESASEALDGAELARAELPGAAAEASPEEFDELDELDEFNEFDGIELGGLALLFDEPFGYVETPTREFATETDEPFTPAPELLAGTEAPETGAPDAFTEPAQREPFDGFDETLASEDPAGDETVEVAVVEPAPEPNEDAPSAAPTAETVLVAVRAGDPAGTAGRIEIEPQPDPGAPGLGSVTDKGPAFQGPGGGALAATGNDTGLGGERERRSGELTFEDQLDLPRNPGGLAMASPDDFDHMWLADSVPTDAVAGDRLLLTPAVGGVRLHGSNEEVFDGKLFAVGNGTYVLENRMGRMTLDAANIVRVERLVNVPLALRTTPFVPTGERVQVRTAGGYLYGHVLSESEGRILLLTDTGARLTLEDVVVEAASQSDTGATLANLRQPD